ncbi:MAG TPA: hypothetical protein VGD54_12560, partial [Steroidobacteraceae bacterium]
MLLAMTLIGPHTPSLVELQAPGTLYPRHCERSEAIHSCRVKKEWIASSQTLLAMTLIDPHTPSLVELRAPGTLYPRHCERSEAIHSCRVKEEWIA